MLSRCPYTWAISRILKGNFWAKRCGLAAAVDGTICKLSSAYNAKKQFLQMQWLPVFGSCDCCGAFNCTPSLFLSNKALDSEDGKILRDWLVHVRRWERRKGFWRLDLIAACTSWWDSIHDPWTRRKEMIELNLSYLTGKRMTVG